MAFGTIQGIVAEGKPRTARMDASSHALISVSYQHHEGHDGKVFGATAYAALANAEVLTISLTTPNTTKWGHFVLQSIGTADATFEFLSDVTTLTGGLAQIPFNFNMNSPNASVMLCKWGHTGNNLIVPTGGSLYIPPISLGSRGISFDRSNNNEFILKQNSNLLFRITNGTTANSVTMLLSWYEHTDKETV